LVFGCGCLEIGLSTLFCLGDPFPRMLERLTDFDVRFVEVVDEGFHALSQKRVNAFRRIARDSGLEFTVHAPFADINIASPNPVLRRVMLKRLEKSLAYARELKCKQWVFHSGWKSGVSEFYPNLDWQTNLRSVRSLIATAKKLGVEIAIENTPEPFSFLVKSMRDIALFYSELGVDADLGMAFDVGHANTTKEIFGFIDKFADKIAHVHVSDNEGKYDQHKGVGYGKIDWKAVAKALKGINYRGVVVCESVDHVLESIEAMRKIFA
jgi:sugar phosphate isomerase/epimerase